ncbi:MAG: hypothetical protein KZQ90_16055 [Candidatus Thiodiazotropha sp. (ex Codakia rugifera)]|nr:hypothetical protein [Candidatus Thiodiazotropha sp. (ex Codakia rugifera)]
MSVFTVFTVSLAMVFSQRE